MIHAGRFDRWITVERNSGTTRDALGGVSETWETLKRLPAQVLPNTGTEAFRSDRTIGVRSARFFVRYFDGLTEKDRISYDSETWNILYFREVGRREALEILAEVRR